MVLLALTFAACPAEWTPRARVRSGGVELERIDWRVASFHRDRAVASVGDFVMAAGPMRVAVAGLARAADSSAPPGTVLRVALLERPDPDDVQGFEPLLVAEGAELSLDGPRLESMVLDGRATLRLTALARTPGGATLRLTRDYSIVPRRDAVILHTRVEHVAGPAARGVAVGARLGWRAQAPFAPGIGSVARRAARARAPWVARVSSGAAFAWTQPSEELELEFVPDMHEAVPITGHTDALSAPRDLAPGRALRHEGVLLAMPTDLVGVARALARMRGVPVRETPVLVTGVTDGRAEVTVERPDGAVALVGALQPGVVRTLPLREGEYVARATAPGHTPSDPVRLYARDGGPPASLAIPPGGHIRYVARAVETGRELPVRIVVRGIEGTRDPTLGPLHSASGAGFVVIAAAGRGEVTVPPGRYELTFSHGPEWTVARARTTVTATLCGDVDVGLRHVLPMSDWTACDLHVHARPSFDSQVTVADRVASLVAAGIEFATPTEHNIVGNYAPGIEALPPAAVPDDGSPALLWVPAVEVTTDQASPPVGHFNIYPYLPQLGSDDGRPPPPLEPPREIFRAARANNPDAIIQVNHPRMSPGIGYFTATGLDVTRNRATSRLYAPDYDAIEVFNGFYLGAPPEVDGVLRDWMALLASGARYIATASSDSHTVAYHQAGYPRTYVYTPRQGEGDAPPDAAAVLRSLRAGHAFGTSGPMLFLQSGAALPGDTVETSEREVTFTVRVMAAPWIDVDRVEIYQDGVQVEALEVPPSTAPLRLERTVVLPVRGARGFVLAVARGDRRMNEVLPQLDALPYAFTNPIWIERTP